MWDDKDFNDKDLEGIQQLGLGSKRNNDESIGQFGIGFNVVYDVTDCPSFFTKGNTLVFDPHCKYIFGADVLKPGDSITQILYSGTACLTFALFPSRWSFQ